MATPPVIFIESTPGHRYRMKKFSRVIWTYLAAKVPRKGEFSPRFINREISEASEARKHRYQGDLFGGGKLQILIAPRGDGDRRCPPDPARVTPVFIIIIIIYQDQQHGRHAVEVIIKVIDKNVDTVFSSSSSKPSSQGPRAERVPRASQWPIIDQVPRFQF